jgi:signal peptidase I
MIFKEVIYMIRNIFIGVFIAVIIVRFIGGIAIVYQESMQTTLYEKDLLWVEKITSSLNLLDRGDIVTIYSPKYIKTGDNTLVKRIIAVEGDHLQIKDGKVYVNGSMLKENYIKGDYTSERNSKFNDIIIRKDYVYVLGDNRSIPILDSRNMGEIPIEDIRGRILFRIFPFDRFGLVDSN